MLNTTGREPTRRRLRNAKKTTGAVSALAVTASALVVTSAASFGSGGVVSAALEGCEGNLISNPEFEDVSGNPGDDFDEDIGLADGWGPIWSPNPGGSTGDLFEQGEWGGSGEPTPASGNYGGFWLSTDSRFIFREGIMNTLVNELEDDSGTTELTFTTSQSIVENGTLAVYGVKSGEPDGLAPTTATDPLNGELFNNNVKKLGEVQMLDTGSATRQQQSILIQTSTLDWPIDRIFLTRADGVSSGTFVHVDDFCMQMPDNVIGNDCGDNNLITNPKFDDVNGNVTAQSDEDISLATGWGPIWDKGATAVSTGDLFAENESNVISALDEPTPASGNYGGLWVNSRTTERLPFREGIMNHLDNPLIRGTGSTVLSFTTSVMLSGSAEMSIYGVYAGADVPALGTPPVDVTTPLNAVLFDQMPGDDNVVGLGTVTFDASMDTQKVLQQVLIDTGGLDRPVDRIFLTHTDNVASGAVFVGVDDFCLPAPVQTDGLCEGNLVSNPKFESFTGTSTLGGHEQIFRADGWGPIWNKPVGGSTGDLYEPGFLIPSADPIPETGNFGAFWAQNDASPSTLFREGIMNQLGGQLTPGSGKTELTFGTTQIFADNATVGVYGVYEGADPLATIVNGSMPANAGLFSGAVVELGTVDVFDYEGNSRIEQRVPIDTEVLEQAIDRIFLTRADTATTDGRAFITVDNFCLPVASESAVTTLAEPERLMDTRVAGETIDGLAQQEGRLGSADNDPFGNSVYRLDVAGRAGIDREAKAVGLNITVVAPDGAGFLSVFPCNGETPTAPNASSLNFGADTGAVANNVTVGLDTRGDVCIFSNVEAHIIVDVGGFFALESGFETELPERYVDTRDTAQSEDLVEGGSSATGKLEAREELRFDIAGLGEVPSDASAVTLNVAAVRSEGNGFLSVYPCEAGLSASSLNFAEGTNVANGVLVGLSEGSGDICVYASVATDVLVDVGGYYPADAGFIALSPARYLDTRPNNGADRTFDGEFSGDGVVSGGSEFTLQLGDRGDLPSDASAVALNITMLTPPTQPEGFASNGFVSVTPGECDGGEAPDTSNLNVSSGDAQRANGAVVDLPDNGAVCVYTSTDANIIIDVNGYFPA